VSSNFLSLLLIITLSLNIHLIVRYRELAKLDPSLGQQDLLSRTVKSKFVACVYTALTTIVAFASLIVSGIRPVIDFGWIMCLGILVAVVTTFVVFPALTIFMQPRQVSANKENRFIDYFKPSTEIYQGMVEIDAKLGGTTPLNIIIDAPKSFLDKPKIQAIQESLDSLAATGKVMSLATTMSVFDGLKNAKPMDNIDLSFMLNVLSDSNKQTLFKPYISDDGNQLHINIRVFETLKGLDRNQLIDDIRSLLIQEHNLEDEQIHISGLLVFYNNMLNSLFSSQILTLGTVFVVIFLMFIVLFRSIKLALITIIPNVFSAGVVLGIMGVFSVPLDLMTITIAAISVGIAVDNSIHFIDRFKNEMNQKDDDVSAIYEATNNVGQAMFYTTIVITTGFLIMVFSNFVPTMYFGVLTALAMITALTANLIMLPMLVAKFKPLS